jgi:hypothetical protein
MLLADMWAPSVAEIVLLARVLSRAEPADRPALAASLLADADNADRHRRRLGKAHPDLGDGSLMARCIRLSPPPEPLGDDSDFLVCLALAAQSVLFHSVLE